MDWIKLLALYLIIQAIIGIWIFESIYKGLSKYQEVNEKRDGKFPQYRRHDAKHWNRWMFYPGAMFLLTTKLILMISIVLFTCFLIKIISYGHDYSTGPMKNGVRKSIVCNIYKFLAGCVVSIAGMSCTLNNLNVDYSYYLGPDYKKNIKKYCKPSTLVANHCSWLDGFILGNYMFPALAVQ